MRIIDLAREVTCRVGVLSLDEVTECVRVVDAKIAEAVAENRDIYIQGFAKWVGGQYSPIYRRVQSGKHRSKR